MRGFERSVIHSPWTDWADELRQRALQPPEAPDDGALLDAFRAHSEYYRQRIAAAATISAVAPLEKAAVADVPLPADTDVTAARTSGTSGFQVTVLNDWREREFRRALLYRPQLFYDLPDDVNQVVFVDGDDCATADQSPKRFDYGGRRYRTWFVGAGADPSSALALLNAVRPTLIRGIASAIVRFIDAAPGSLDRIRPRYVCPGGEFLRPEWRARMADAFDTTVLDRYGSTETGAIAWECPYCGRYHANGDEILLEPTADGLLATPLFISTQPLLRYRLGDQLDWVEADSNCVIRLPVVTIREARRDDWLIDGRGCKVSPLGFQFEQVPGLTAWRVHQLSDGALEIYFDADNARPAAQALQQAVSQAVAGRPLRLIEGVWRLQRSGKFKRVSSDMPS